MSYKFLKQIRKALFGDNTLFKKLKFSEGNMIMYVMLPMEKKRYLNWYNSLSIITLWNIEKEIRTKLELDPYFDWDTASINRRYVSYHSAPSKILQSFCRCCYEFIKKIYNSTHKITKVSFIRSFVPKSFFKTPKCVSDDYTTCDLGTSTLWWSWG